MEARLEHVSFESRLPFAAAAHVASQSVGQVSSQGFVIIGLSSTRL